MKIINYKNAILIASLALILHLVLVLCAHLSVEFLEIWQKVAIVTVGLTPLISDWENVIASPIVR